MRLQSAMEYLMTYGWAILIIAVVLGVLYYLGVFNTANLAPRLQPGSCHVSRTSAGAQNFGVCAGLPEFVASLNGSNAPNVTTSLAYPAGNSTACIWEDGNWYKSTSWGFEIDSAFQLNTNYAGVIDVWASNSNSNRVLVMSMTSAPTSQWRQVCVTRAFSSGSTYSDAMYLDGALVKNASDTEGSLSNGVGWVGGGSPFQNIHLMYPGSGGYGGQIANVQIYNASLSSTAVHALYMEGIGGAPIIPQSIMAWYPLNGDANDYSGNNNNGQANNVQYTNTWINGYSAP